MKNITVDGSKPIVSMKCWFISDGRLYGDAYGHPRFLNGSFIHTSRIIKIIKRGDNKIVETRNTIYICPLSEKLENY